MLGSLIAWLTTSGLASWAGSGAVYPVANLLHLLGLVLLIGGIGVVDLALLGAFPALPTDAVSRSLTPFAIAGFALMAISGATMFAADAAVLAAAPVFRWKLLLIALALANVAAYRVLAPGGRLVRALAAVSLAGWLGVAVLGRMIAYS